MTKLIPNKPYKPVPISECDLKEGLLLYSGLYQEALISQRSLNIKTGYIRCSKAWANITFDIPLGADPSEEEDQKDYPFRCGRPGCCTPTTFGDPSDDEEQKPTPSSSTSEDSSIPCGMLGCCAESWILGPFYTPLNVDPSQEEYQKKKKWLEPVLPGSIGGSGGKDETDYVSWWQYTEVLKRLVFQLLDCLAERRFDNKMEALCLKNAWVTEDSVKDIVNGNVEYAINNMCAYDIDNLDTVVSDMVGDCGISTDQIDDFAAEVGFAVENKLGKMSYVTDTELHTQVNDCIDDRDIVDTSCVEIIVNQCVAENLINLDQMMRVIKKQWIEDALKQFKSSRTGILQEIWRRINVAFSVIWKGKK